MPLPLGQEHMGTETPLETLILGTVLPGHVTACSFGSVHTQFPASSNPNQEGRGMGEGFGIP